MEVIGRDRSIMDLTAEDFSRVIEKQTQEGTDFMIMYCSVTRSALARLKAEGRITDIVSQDDAFLACWIIANQAENPLLSKSSTTACSRSPALTTWRSLWTTRSGPAA